jgi:hypothetical protein
MQNELDKNLHYLFQEQRASLPEEPFLKGVLKRIERRRARKAFIQRAIFVIGICIVAWFSPYLIKGSALLSNELDVLFKLAGSLIKTPTGMLSAAAVILLLFIFKRRRFSLFV